MKSFRIFFVCVFVFCSVKVFAQAPYIQWDKTFGGTKDDVAHSIYCTKDNGYIVIGDASSDDGNVFGLHGSDDVWILKLDSIGGVEWIKCFGGTGSDEGRSIIQTIDNGFVFASSTTSNNGDVSGLHSLGRTDFWIVSIDSLGIIQWQKCFGGTQDDNAIDIIELADSGFLVTGTTASFDGDVTGFHGDEDLWVIKISMDGQKIWTKSLGGLNYDGGNSLIQTKDGGFLIAGSTLSNDGDVTGFHGVVGADAWVVKLNSSGQLLWQKCYGGNGVENATDIMLSSDGGFFISSPTSSHDGDVSGSFGLTDYWIIKADSVGTILWQKCLGSVAIESSTSASPTSDGGIVVVGNVLIDTGMVSGTHGGWDYWVCKLDGLGSFEWAKAIGGSQDDHPYAIREISDGGYVIAGSTVSSDGDITIGTHGLNDYWIVKLAPPGLSVPEIEHTLKELIIFQNHDQLNLRFFSKKDENATIFLYDVNGRKIVEKKISVNEGINYTSINCSGIAKGMYMMRVVGRKE